MSPKSIQKKRYRLLSLIMAVMLVVGLAFSVSVPAFAVNSVNENVTDVSNSLMQVRMVYKNDDGDEIAIQGGTGFLINDNTVLTCAHVVDVDSETDELLKELFGSKYKKSNLSLQVVVSGDVTIPATLKKESQSGDFAILNLNETIGNRTPASLGDSESVEATQLVYALGFPASVARLQNKNTYTSSDVTITDGKVSKLNSSDGIDYIQHGAILTEGNSGGPLVDENGAVIGINKGQNDNYYYAISINQVKEVLDALEIQYNDGAAVVIPEDPTTVGEVTDPVTEAVTEAAQTTTPSDNEEDKKDDVDTTKLIIIIAIIVLVVILGVVIIVFVVSSKKKSADKIQTPVRQAPVMPQMQHTPVNRPSQPQPPVPPQQYGRPSAPAQGSAPTMPSNEGAGETSVLNDGAGETTVLGNQATGFFLVRKSNNERININKPEFLIGKERRRVDYCISDNNSVSRAHAKIKVRAGRCYISDLGSTNCTFVNGSRLSPNQEVILSKGDKIKISDEEFEFLG